MQKSESTIEKPFRLFWRLSLVKNLFYLNKYFVKYKWYLLSGIAFVILSNYFGLLIPRQIRIALDFVQQNLQKVDSLHDKSGFYNNEGIRQALLRFAGIVIGLSMLKGFLMYWMRQTIIVMSRYIEYDLRNEIYDHLQEMDLAYYKRHKTGDIMSRIAEDVNKVRMYLGPAILYGINLVSLFVLTIAAMFRVNSTLTWYTLIPLPILSLSIYYVSSLIHDRSSNIQKQLSLLTSETQEVYSGIRVIKSYVKEVDFGRFFARECDLYRSKGLSLARINALFFPVMIFLISMSTLIVVFVGGHQVRAGYITPGNIAEFIIYVGMLTWPVTAIGWIASIVQQAEASMARINELLREKPEISKSGQINNPLKGKIEFRRVSFVYPDSGIRALDDISFSLLPGERMAIIGRTASGKSTIAELLLRMYDPTDGEILLDGKNIKEYDLDHLRQSIGYVPQDVFLFSDSVYSNIRFGADDVDKKDVSHFAEKAAIHREILQLPDGYDTVLGERGVNLSGGQKQRISIARAFIKNPDIFILDDCLSALDNDTEKEIMTYLHDVLHGKTAIIITHRVTNLLNFDKIMVLDHGKIVQWGNHKELMAQDGPYKNLVGIQQG